MTSTTQKHRDFVNEPMGTKAVDHLPGIGRATADKMRSQGIDSATGVFGKYLSLNQNKKAFQGWMKESYGSSAKHSSDCYNALNEWADNRL